MTTEPTVRCPYCPRKAPAREIDAFGHCLDERCPGWHLYRSPEELAANPYRERPWWAVGATPWLIVVAIVAAVWIIGGVIR